MYNYCTRLTFTNLILSLIFVFGCFLFSYSKSFFCISRNIPYSKHPLNQNNMKGIHYLIIQVFILNIQAFISHQEQNQITQYVLARLTGVISIVSGHVAAQPHEFYYEAKYHAVHSIWKTKVIVFPNLLLQHDYNNRLIGKGSTAIVTRGMFLG
jgi:hypothetical protein